jgi:OFA family oxalate/formate antiporter-like MFS transporter
MVESAEVEPTPVEPVPKKAWAVVAAATAINLGLGILYTWNVWAGALVNKAKAGQLITAGPAAGWTYLTDANAANPYSLCLIFYALMLLLGGRIHDKFGPRIGPISGGLSLALGCIIAGLSKSYVGLILGFGILGGLGLGLAQAAAIPAALRWFGPRQRGLVAGLVVGAYAAGALYVAPLTAYLIKAGGVSFSWIFLGLFFGTVVTVAGSRLAWPKPGYLPPTAPLKPGSAPNTVMDPPVELRPGKMLGTWQFYVLVLMFMGASQAGLLIIANTAGLLAKAGKTVPFLAANAGLLAFFGPLVDVCGRIGTGKYSDNLGRKNAFSLNCLVVAACLLVLPSIIGSGNLFLLFLAVGLAYWAHGGLLALVPAYVADFYGTKNLGMNYPLMGLGWPLGFFMARIFPGILKNKTGSMNMVFYLSAIVLITVIILARLNRRPLSAEE